MAVEDIEAVRLGTHRKLLQQYKGAVGLPSHQAVDGGKDAVGGCCGRTKAGLRPAARQERRQKHRTEQEPDCFHGTKINIFPAAREEGMARKVRSTIQQRSIFGIIPQPDAESPDKDSFFY